MRATYELTRDDLAALIEYHGRSSPASRRQLIGCLGVALCALMILPAGILLTTDKQVLETAMDIWPLLLGPLLFVIAAGSRLDVTIRDSTLFQDFLTIGRLP